jgi:anthranilate synthase/phosphoribosyltransferase
MILMIDNYDSFTYNLVQYFMQLGEEVQVFRNDELTVEKAEELEFDYLVISPGPGSPKDSGCSLDLIGAFAGRKPILGVCLGHQAIGEVFGGKVVSAHSIMHGKSDMIKHDGKSIFAGLPNPLRVIRYHSLALEKKSMPKDFEISATGKDNEIMAIRHKSLRVEGVQFHPESIGTEEGMKLLTNFLSGIKEVPPVKSLLKRAVSGKSLTEDEAGHVMDQVTEGTITPAQIGSFLTSLTIKGVSVEELTGFARVLYKKAKSVPLPNGFVCSDTCGTGGDDSGTFNISTACAFVACGAGVKIAKHGNRSITSKSGSADVLEALGVKIDMTPEQAAEALKKTGMCFLFAPLYHPAFKNIMGPRRELGFRTVFNMMGPMLNPAKVQSQVMGVFSPELTELAAQVLGNLGVKHALVVHGNDGIDELTLTTGTKVTELKEGWMRTWNFDPDEYGFDYCKPKDLKGGSAEDSAGIIRRILSGEKGFRRDVVVINAAAAILAADIAPDFQEAIAKAKESIDSGKAKDCLDKLVEFSKGL